MLPVSQILKVGSICVLLLAGVTGCKSLAKEEKRGYIATKPVEEAVEVGKSRKSDVRRALGSPSTVSAFPPETWYYISRENETVGPFARELIEQQVVRIEFDDEGVVSHLEGYAKDKVQDVDYVARKTPTEGRKLGVFEQILGNVGRYNQARDASTTRQ